MTTKLGSNLLKDASAEAAKPSASGYEGVVPIPGWTTTSGMTVDFYGESGGDLSAAAAPPKAGSNYFYGGPANSSSSASQTVHFGDLAAAIDAGEITATIGGYLGGFGTQTDHADISVSFLDARGGVISVATVAGPTSFPSGSALTHEATTVVVPDGAVAATYTLTATRDQGSDNDGLADKLTFVLKQTHTAAAIAAVLASPPLSDLMPAAWRDGMDGDPGTRSAASGAYASTHASLGTAHPVPAVFVGHH